MSYSAKKDSRNLLGMLTFIGAKRRKNLQSMNEVGPLYRKLRKERYDRLQRQKASRKANRPKVRAARAAAKKKASRR